MSGLWLKFKKLIKLLFFKPIYRFYPRRYEKTVWLFGAGRSGTTWIASLINHDNSFRELFEPFHHVYPEAQLCGFTKHLYLKPNKRNKSIENLAKRILHGKFYHPRVEEGNPVIWASLQRKLLVKDVFANLLAYRICKVDKSVKPVLLVRNPFAVALSKLGKKNWFWMTEPRDLLQQSDLLNDYLEPFQDMIHTVAEQGSYIDKQILIWAVINYVPLLQFKEDEVLITFYEDWVKDPNAELHRVLEFIDSDAMNSLDIRDSEKFTAPSKTSFKKAFHVADWKKEISQDEIDSGLRILKYFGLHKLYDEFSMPDPEALARFRSKGQAR